MATLTVANPRHTGSTSRPSRLKGGNYLEAVDGYTEAASQTYAQGAPLFRDGSNGIKIATSSAGLVTSKVIGFATEAASGTTGEPVSVMKLQAGDRYLMNVKGADGTLVKPSDVQIGTPLPLDIQSGKLVLNPDDTLDTSKLYGIPRSVWVDETGHSELDDTYGRMVVEIPDQIAIQ